MLSVYMLVLFAGDAVTSIASDGVSHCIPFTV